MGTRTRTRIIGLKSVRLAEERPAFIPKPSKSKMSAAQRDGLRYEKKIYDLTRAYLSRYNYRVFHGAWYEFEDSSGPGYASPDVLAIPPDTSLPLIVLECKRTWRTTGFKQLKGIYRPLTEACFPGHKLRCLQVCFNLSRAFGKWKGHVVTKLDDVFEPGRWIYATLQWRTR